MKRAVVVLKFGGTSVASLRGLATLKARVTAETERLPWLVVSALKGTTDLLVAALARPSRARECLARIRNIHRRRACSLLPGAEANTYLAWLDERLLEADQCLGGFLSKSRADRILGLGEWLSARLMQRLLEQFLPDVVFVDARTFLVTDDCPGEANPLMEPTRKRLAGLDLGRARVVVSQGFVGATAQGVPTTLGRGGSDLSATVLGVCLDAVSVEIWTDVDGVLSADPQHVPGARTIERLHYHDAVMLARHGARVLHPRCLSPVVPGALPVEVRNSFNRKAAGTLITAHTAPPYFAMATAIHEKEAQLCLLWRGWTPDEVLRSLVTPGGQIYRYGRDEDNGHLVMGVDRTRWVQLQCDWHDRLLRALAAVGAPAPG